jgi:hypothetical protein
MKLNPMADMERDAGPTCATGTMSLSVDSMHFEAKVKSLDILMRHSVAAVGRGQSRQAGPPLWAPDRRARAG